MFSSAVTMNMNNCLSVNKQIGSNSCSSIMSSIDFSVTEKKTASSSSYSNKFLNRVNDKNVQGNSFCRAAKGSGISDQNKNSLVKYTILNGNKEKSMGEDGVPVPKIQLYLPGKISLEWREVRRIGAGLKNLGNTCFMNTVLQCLTYIAPLSNYLLHDAGHVSKCKINGFCMLCELEKHVKRVLNRPGDVIRPENIYHRLRSIAKHFHGGRQEDAHEFLRFVIDGLYKSCLLNYDGYQKLDNVSKETTVINQIFSGYLRSQVTCLRCKEKSNTYDHFMELMLDIKNASSLEVALAKFMQPELLQNENAYKCHRCKIKVSAHKKFTVHRPPNVATIQLKRFDFNKVSRGKISKHIAYPDRFDLRPYMSDNKGPPVTYCLASIVVHQGFSCSSGHYFCYVKNSNGVWHCVDDARVHQAKMNEALNQEAYILFYVRSKTSENACVKKPLEAVVSNRKNVSVVKNGFSAFSSNGVSGTGISRPCNSLKPSPLPSMPRLSSLYTSLPNGTPKNVNKKQHLPLSQNRDKVAFSFQQANSNANRSLTNSSNEFRSGTSKGNPVTVQCATTISKKLVPYLGDSSESSDEETSKVIANSKSGDSSVKPASSFPKESANSARTEVLKVIPPKVFDQKDERNICNETQSTISSTGLPDSLALCQSHLNPKTFTSLSAMSKTIDLSHSNCSSLPQSKSKPTPLWNVSDKHLHSPSMASGSSTNSVNSTTDWDVTELDNMTKKKSKRNYSGWSIQNMDETAKESTEQKSVSLYKAANFDQIAINANVSTNSEIFASKVSEIHAKKCSHVNEISRGSSEKLSGGIKLKCDESNTSDCEFQQIAGAVMKKKYTKSDLLHSPVSKECLSHTSLISNAGRQDVEKQANNFRPQSENGFIPTKQYFREHVDRNKVDKSEGKCPIKRPCSQSPQNGSKEGDARHSNSHEIGNNTLCKRFKGEKINSNKGKGDHEHYAISAMDSSQKVYKDRKHYNLLINKVCSPKAGSKTITENKIDVRSKRKVSDIASSSESSADSSDNSSSSEYEWVEKTKESIEAGKVPLKDIPIKVWDSHDKANFKQSENKDNGHSKKQDNNAIVSELPKNSTCAYGASDIPIKVWDSHDKANFKQNENKDNGRSRNQDNKAIVSELLKNSTYAYGASVSSWNGGTSLLDVVSRNENARKRSLDFQDDWDEECDRGKVRKTKKNGFKPVYFDHNPFQRAQNMQNNQNAHSHESWHEYGQPHKKHHSHHDNSDHKKHNNEQRCYRR